MNELVYKIAITQLPRIGDIIGKKLIAACGSVEQVFQEKRSHLLKVEHIGQALADLIIQNRDAAMRKAEEELPFIEKHGITPLFYLDAAYPNKLKHCSDSPMMLYYKGNADLQTKYIISVVGTRNATSYGIDLCNSLIRDLSDMPLLVVSGLAYGIDAAAHKAALENKLPTVGVLAHGLDRIYPATHKNMAAKMVNQGGLLTEYLKNTIPDRENFPSRNRIVAGMADATIVIESSIRGGAIITAEIANSYSRDVFVYPGRVNDEYSAGCNYMIKANKAALIENAGDLKYHMGWQDMGKTKKAKQITLFREFNPDEESMVQFIRTHETASIDYICNNLNMPMSKIIAILLNLEMEGIVKALPGKQYRLN